MSAPPDAPLAPARRLGWRGWLGDLAIVAGAAAVITAVLYRVWSWPLRVPFTYRGDSIGLMAFVKIVAETGWYTGTPRAGAPFGLNTYDFPYGGDNGWWVLVKVLTWFTHDAALVLNLLFMGGFVLVALSAFVALRIVGAGRVVSGALALVYAFAPSHFLRTTGQLFIGAPVSVPLACALAIRLLRGDTPLLRTGRGRLPRLDLRNGLAVFALVSCVILGSFDPYYLVFGALVIGAGGILAAAARRRWLPVLSAAVLVVLMTVVLVLNSIPTFLWRRSHGLNPEVAQRPIEDLDTYALRPIQMIAPVPKHRIGFLAHLSELLTRPGAQSEPYQYLGLVAVIGVAVALGSLVVWAAGRRSKGDGLRDRSALGALVVVLGAFAVTGGLSWIAYTVGLSQIRSWNRVAIVMAFLGLVALVPALSAGQTRVRRLGLPKLGAVAVGAVLVGLALFDQIGVGMIADPRANSAEWNSDKAFVGTIESRLPEGAMVFQLPYAPWPESGPINGLIDQDLWRGYLHSDHLRWSFAGMKGREADWQEYTSRQPAADMVDAVTAAGFDGIYLDRAGYTDPTLEDGIRAALDGQEPLVSGDGRLAFFDLRAHRDALTARLGVPAVQQLGHDTLYRPRVEYRDGFAPRAMGVPDIERGGRSTNTMLLVNDAGPFEGALTFSVNSYSTGTHQLTVHLPDGTDKTFPITPDATAISIPMTVAPGTSTVTITTDAPEVPIGYRDLSFNLVNAFVVRA